MKAFIPADKLERVFSGGFDSGLMFVLGCTLVSGIFLAGMFFDLGSKVRPEAIAFVVLIVLVAAWGLLMYIKNRSEARARQVGEILASGRSLKSETTEDGHICLKADTSRNFDLGAGTQRISATLTAKISLAELEKLQSLIDLSNRSRVLSLPSGCKGEVVEVEGSHDRSDS